MILTCLSQIYLQFWLLKKILKNFCLTLDVDSQMSTFIKFIIVKSIRIIISNLVNSFI